MSKEPFDLLLLGGTVVTGQGMRRADVGMRDGRISAVEEGLTGARETVDVTGLHLLPGVIDTQVHFREPGMTHKEDIESGTRAAAMGGVTTVFEMPNTDPTTTTPDALQHKLERARATAWCRINFFVGASPDNVDRLAELERLPGTPGIKVFMGSSTGSLLVEDRDLLRRVMQSGCRPMPVHAEDEARLRERKPLAAQAADPAFHPEWRDPETAVLATTKLIELCAETGRPVHILHISTADELPLIREAKRHGLPVTCEATPQHLLLDSALYAELGTKLQMNPPVRDASHREAIAQAFLEGLFDVVGSDHAPHTADEKARPYPQSPSGMPGVQTTLPLLLDWSARGGPALPFLVQRLCENPAALYGIRDVGRLETGSLADLSVVDLAGEFEVTSDWLQSKCGWSPYEGRKLKGKPVHTLVGGKFVVRDAALLARPENVEVSYHWKP